MKKFTYLIALLALTACSNDDNEIQIDNRTPITFSATTGTEVVATPMTKTLTSPTTTAFSSNTRILMRIKSEDGSSSPTSPKYTRTVAIAAGSESGTESNVSFGDNDKRYWDDAHGRSSQLSVFAVAIENVSEATCLPVDKLTTGTSTWFTEESENENIVWEVSTAQDATTLKNNNLVYSNNISPNGHNGVKPQVSTSSTTSDGTLQFREDSSTPGHGKFDQGHMIFNHALTKITVNLTAGTGFSSGFTDITTGSIVGTVKNAPYSGTLDLATGKWNDGPSTNDVKMATENDKISHTALILPGMSITSGSTIDIIDFDINGNVYHITSDMIWKGIIEGDRNEALGVENNGTSGNFLQGKHYIINATFGKTAIESVSASVVGWSDVEVQNVKPTNAYITISLYTPDNGSTCENFDLYRLLQTGSPTTSSGSNPTDLTNWSGDYGTKATLEETSTGSKKYKTNWYFESNSSYYHFRTVNGGETLTTTDGKSTFTIKSGFKTDNVSDFNDPHWGAPMTADPTEAYDSDKGFTSTINSAIGATTSDITITELHMLSNVFVQLKSDNNSGDANQLVNLTDATVQLLQLGNEATVDMGSGKIEAPTSTSGNTSLKLTTESNKYFSPIVPQLLNRGDNKTDKVGIKITTTDGNVYQVDDISNYTITTTESTTTKVDRWYPNHQYTYTFNLLKTGINTVTCTVTGWQSVDVNGGNVTIE